MRSLIVAAALISMAAGVFFSQRYNQSDSVYILQSTCRFEQGLCLQKLGHENVLSLQLYPIDLPAMEPLWLNVSGSAVEKFIQHDIKVWFEGRDMSMGQHFMLPVDEMMFSEEQIPQGFAAHVKDALYFKGMVPVCSVDAHMAWRLVVEVPAEMIPPDAELVPGKPSRLQIHFDLF